MTLLGCFVASYLFVVCFDRSNNVSCITSWVLHLRTDRWRNCQSGTLRTPIIAASVNGIADYRRTIIVLR